MLRIVAHSAEVTASQIGREFTPPKNLRRSFSPGFSCKGRAEQVAYVSMLSLAHDSPEARGTAFTPLTRADREVSGPGGRSGTIGSRWPRR